MDGGMEMKLTKRLAAVASFVERGSIPVDVGTDQGYIPVHLIEKGICTKVYATDISQGSLEKAEDFIHKNAMEDRIVTRLGAGLSIIQPGEVNVVIIAGMGGYLIRDILEESPAVLEKADRLILHPMVAQDALRRWLISNDYSIVDEELVQEDNRFYEIIVAGHGTEKYEREIYFDIGLKLLEKRHPLLQAYLEKKMATCRGLIKHLKTKGTEKAMNRYHELIKKLNEYEEVYKWIVHAK
jgi:tRNA (adenine22-N1)-methyltransferase